MTSASREPFVTYLELRESTPDGEAGAGLSHTSKGLVLLHVLELASHGEPRGAVTIVHDAGDHGGRYLSLGHALATEGWAVALPDLRGHGRSEGERGHSNGIREIVRDLGDVQDHLAYRQPDAPRVLVGQGLGALWALAFACERSEGIAALVLASPLFAPKFDPPERAGGLKKFFSKLGPMSPGRTGWSAEQRTSDPAAQRELQTDELVHGIVTLRSAEEALEAARRYVPKLAHLKMPVLLLAGAKDELIAVDEVRAAKSSRIDVELFAGARHDLFHETRASDVTATLTRWLEAKLPR